MDRIKTLLLSAILLFGFGQSVLASEVVSYSQTQFNASPLMLKNQCIYQSFVASTSNITAVEFNIAGSATGIPLIGGIASISACASTENTSIGWIASENQTTTNTAFTSYKFNIGTNPLIIGNTYLMRLCMGNMVAMNYITIQRQSSDVFSGGSAFGYVLNTSCNPVTSDLYFKGYYDNAYAVPIITPTETISAIMTPAVNESTNIFLTIIQNYWTYILIFSIIAIFIYKINKLTNLKSKNPTGYNKELNTLYHRNKSIRKWHKRIMTRRRPKYGFESYKKK